MLIALGGLPGVGKSTLARALARRIGAVHLRIDTIEQALRNAGLDVSGPEGYLAARDLAEDNLRIGHTVIVDSVNPVGTTRDYWRETAARPRRADGAPGRPRGTGGVSFVPGADGRSALPVDLAPLLECSSCRPCRGAGVRPCNPARNPRRVGRGRRTLFANVRSPGRRLSLSDTSRQPTGR